MRVRNVSNKTQRRRRVYDPTSHRLREIERLIRDRHCVMPDTDDAIIYLRPVAQCLRRLCERRTGPRAATLPVRMQNWAMRFAPNVAEHVIDEAVIEAERRDVIDKADALARTLRVSYDERQRLKLRTIGAYDVDKAGRKRRAAERRRERDRLRKLAQYRAEGRVERATYLAQSLSRTKPWEVEGASRRTWERRRKAQPPRDASVSPHEVLTVGRHTCVTGTAAGAATPRTIEERKHFSPLDHLDIWPITLAASQRSGVGVIGRVAP